MKNKNMIVIVVLAIVLVGGMYFFATKDNGKVLVKDEPPVVDAAPQTPETAEKPATSKYPNIAVGELAPDFTLKNLEGEEISLSDYRGKIVMINFWATWCVYCDIEMPEMQKLQDENDDLVILAVDVQETHKEVEEYIEKGGYNFEVVLDEDGEIYKGYLGSGLPNWYFIDKEGILLGKYPGAMNFAQMNEKLDIVRELE